MRKSKIFSSLWVKITVAVLLVLFAALVLINIIIINAMGNSLIERRMEDQKKTVLSSVPELSAMIYKNDWHGITDYCVAFGEKNNCRILVFNQAASVVADNYSEFYGASVSNKEVNDCLFEGMSFSAGTYLLPLKDNGSFVSEYIPDKEGRDEYWAIYTAARAEYDNELVGAVLISSPFQDIVDEVNALTLRIILISVAVGIAVSVIIVLLLRRYFQPLKSMSGAIAVMSKGDFKVRAQAGKGQDELAELASAFNGMCARMETLEESRNKFVSDASHEMKTPLATMKILVDSLINQSGTDEAIYKEFLSDISHEIDRLTYLINDLLTLVRMDKSEEVPNYVPIQITDLLDKVRHKLQPLAAMKGIEIKLRSEGDPTVVGDAMKLQQAFSNLVDNAIKYSPEDTTISIGITKDSKNAVISVSDQGIGISDEDLRRIFERFYRVDKARSRETGGTGLGLSIVESIVKQHNGSIGVQSVKGSGSTFTVELPLQPLK